MGASWIFRKALFALGLAAAVCAWHPSPAQAAAPRCSFVLGFKALHDVAAATVGDCLDNQSSSPNGDAVQHSSKGLLVWRKADNWTAFTNGYETWINGRPAW